MAHEKSKYNFHYAIKSNSNDLIVIYFYRVLCNMFNVCITYNIVYFIGLRCSNNC